MITTNRFTTTIRHQLPAPVRYCLLLFAAGLLLSAAPAIAQGVATTREATDTMNRATTIVLIKNAIQHALDRFAVEVSVDDALLNEPIAVLTDGNLPSDRWLSHAFRRFNTVCSYDERGSMQSLQILGTKTNRGDFISADTVASRSQRDGIPQGIVTAEARQSAVDDLPPGVILNQGGESEPPDDVIIHNETKGADSLPEGVVPADPQARENSAPAGIELPQR